MRAASPLSSRALAAAVRARLAPVCVGWPADDFAALVADVVHFRERWSAPDGRERPAAPRAVTLSPLPS